MKLRRAAVISRFWFLSLLVTVSASALAQASSSVSTSSTSASSAPDMAAPGAASPDKTNEQETKKHAGIAGELVKETREAAGEDEEENANLKHSSSVRWLAAKTGLPVHQAHLLSSGLNFVIVAVVIIWAGRKYLPSMFRNRTAGIQQALQEARTASEDANRRLADIESRLRDLDAEIGQMKTNAEREANAEEERIRKGTEDDIRKVVVAAEQEIARAAKQARRELTTHTASLAITLASRQIHVDTATDQRLVHTFAVELASNDSSNHASQVVVKDVGVKDGLVRDKDSHKDNEKGGH